MAEQIEAQRPGFRQELIAFLCLVAGLFVGLCLVSFTSPDLGDTASNWGGALGHLFATALMSFAGISSFWLPLLFFFVSFSLFRSPLVLDRLPQLSAGMTGVVVCSAILLGSSGVADFSVFGRQFPLAGYLGSSLFGFLATYLGGPGLVLISLALLLVSFLVILRLSPVTLWTMLRAAFVRLGQVLRSRQQPQSGSAPAQAAEGQKSLPVPVEEEPAPSLLLPPVKEPVSLQQDDDGEFEPTPVEPGEYRLPSLNLLDKSEGEEVVHDKEHYLEVSQNLQSKLLEFGVKGKVVGISPGPVITTYEFEPAPGVKINKVVSLADDLALGLKAPSVRIVGSIPGKAAMGIEIPNQQRQIVYVRDIFSTTTFQQAPSKLTLGLGMDVVGNPVSADLARMPHLLIAGATGAGKSVAINTIISSILMKSTPDEVRLLMVDPKRIELSGYEGIPHLLHPVVVDPKMASRALNWAVREMERRYGLMEEQRVKSFGSYNQVSEEKLPLIVIIIDELADLMMVSSNEVEGAVARLAQMARAAGMHLILATQRPSVDVLTGLIKANFPTRMSFKVSSKIDSRTILDTSGAEHLLGAGDMLFLPPGTASLQRIHGAYISEAETERLVSFLKEQGAASYDEEIIKSVEEEVAVGPGADEEYDDKYDEAVAIVCESGQASISMVQRRLRIGYNRAARIIETMEREGLIGPADGAKPREILARQEYGD